MADIVPAAPRGLMDIPGLKQAGLLAGVAAAVAAAIWLVLWSQGQNYTVLYLSLIHISALMHELQRLDYKLNVLLRLTAELAMRQSCLPRACPVRFSARGFEWLCLLYTSRCV